jgi:hypothetical protein
MTLHQHIFAKPARGTILELSQREVSRVKPRQAPGTKPSRRNVRVHQVHVTGLERCSMQPGASLDHDGGNTDVGEHAHC